MTEGVRGIRARGARGRERGPESKRVTLDCRAGEAGPLVASLLAEMGDQRFRSPGPGIRCGSEGGKARDRDKM